jgi:hypothetical protein
VPAVAGSARSATALLPDVPPQGASPLLGEPPAARRTARRRCACSGQLR